MNLQQQLPETWRKALRHEFAKPYFLALQKNVNQAYGSYTVFPPIQDIFAAFEAFSFSETKVVILGQDPYHGVGQAHGLSFSVPKGQQTPPSLRNIFLALQKDLGGNLRQKSDLSDWAQQGVLLLNTTLTVQKGKAFSHKDFGWDNFTQAVIQKLSEELFGVVFLLWGNAAQDFGKLVDTKKHHVLTASHPSPLSAYRGFLDCKHFSLCNSYLRQNGRTEIDWLGFAHPFPQQQKIIFS